MRRLAAVLLLALAACASPDAARVTRSPKPTARDGYVRQPVEWFLRSADGTNVAIVYHMSGVASECEREGGATVEESDDVVIISAWKLVTTDRGRACTEELGYVDDTVELERPLGARKLSGCRPPATAPSEDPVCRDEQRSRDAGVFEFSPPPASPAARSGY